MPTRVLRKPKKKYPYRIFPVDLPDLRTIKRTRPRKLWRFLEVQALLRSEKIQEIYRQGKRKGAPLLFQQEFRFLWEYFTGPLYIGPEETEHHPSTKFLDDFEETGILDLVKMKKALSDDPRDSVDWLNEIAFNQPFPRLTVLFDRLVPTETIIKNLRPLLQQRDMSQPEGAERRWRRYRIIDPTVPKTYLDYLRSYDLYHCEQLEPREIGQRVYPTYEKPTVMARTAVKRAKKIIQQAEKGEWPPTI